MLLPMTGGDPHAPVVYWVSLAFTFIGAAVFSTIRGQRARIPQEAIIGICYAVASAAAILAMSKATSESEHLKDMLVGNILAVSWPEVGKTAALYGAIGLFHYIFRQQVPRDLDRSTKTAEARGISVRFWDFLFYASFGFVVTSSVVDCRRAAGVLLPDRAVGRGDAVRRHHRATSGDRLDDGDGRVGARACTCRSCSICRPARRSSCTFGVVLALMAAVRPLIRRTSESGDGRAPVRHARLSDSV